MKDVFKKITILLSLTFILVGLTTPVYFGLADTVCPQGTVIGPDGNSCVPTYQLLAPLPNMGTNFNPTDQSALGTYLNLMIKLFIGICAVLAVIMIVMGGIEYMTSELISNKEHGKEKITGAIFGLLLALGAWLILSTINPDILKTDLKSLAKVEVSVELKNDNIPQTPTMVNGKLMYGGYEKGANFSSKFPQNSLANLPAGVTLGGRSQCINIGDENCTSTLGLDTSIISTMASDCAAKTGKTCPIVINAGTEFWLHAKNTSHKPGGSTVDIGATPAMNLYISGDSSTFPKDGSTYTEGGVCYYAESAGATSSTTGNHWHVYKC